MLKGFIVIFTGLISYYIFKRKFKKGQVVGVLIVVIGLVTVGLSNIYSYNSKFAPRPVLGNSLVILAQFFLALMFVYEEKILKEYDVNVFEIVGWEGIWGMLISSIFISIFYLLPGRDFGSWENPIQATLQLGHNNYLLAAILLSSIVIGPFNYYGTNLTKYSSAMHRCLIDASRMLVVWLISIVFKWEQFKIQQAIGYSFVLIGNMIYYEIIKLPLNETNNENLPISKSDETLQLPKNQEIIGEDKESNIQSGSLKKLSTNENKDKEESIFSKLYKFFYKRETNHNEKINNICSVQDTTVSNNIDEREGLKDKKIAE